MQDFWIFANLIRNFVECVLYAPPHHPQDSHLAPIQFHLTAIRLIEQ